MNTGNGIVDASVSNNNEPLPVTFIGHKCTKPVIHNSYTSGNPNPQSQDLPSTDEIILSAFLQTRAWPLCVRNVQCEKPTIVHRPDVCVVLKELANNVPAGRNMFRIPILICEIEGSKKCLGRRGARK